jgi:hypothetical protein
VITPESLPSYCQVAGNDERACNTTQYSSTSTPLFVSDIFSAYLSNTFSLLMSEKIIFIVFLVLVAGQVIAVAKSHIAGVVYYICIAPVSYFSIWDFITWDPARVCGLVLIVGGIVLGHLRRRTKSRSCRRFAILCAYGVAVTFIGSRWWPIMAMQDSSSAYSSLRPLVAILNWLIVCGVSWNIAVAFGKADLERLVKPILIASVILCFYAVVQYVAFNAGHPLTGIRRPAASHLEQVGMSEEQAAYQLDGSTHFRPGSLVGEPKGLGAAIVLWLAFLMTRVFYMRVGTLWTICMVLLVATLWLTASTSALLSAMLVMPLTWSSGMAHGNRKVITRIQLLLVCGIFGGFGLWITGTLSGRLNSASEIWNERVTNRVLINQEIDPVEKKALEVLSQYPAMMISGCGIGGISLFIADRLGRTQTLILSPNNGLLGDVCDIGVLGIALMLFASWRGIRIAISRGSQIDGETKAIAIAGLAAFIQCLICPQSWLTSVGYGLLLGAEMRLCVMNPFARCDGLLRNSRQAEPVLTSS